MALQLHLSILRSHFYLFKLINKRVMMGGSILIGSCKMTPSTKHEEVTAFSQFICRDGSARIPSDFSTDCQPFTVVDSYYILISIFCENFGHYVWPVQFYT